MSVEFNQLREFGTDVRTFMWNTVRRPGEFSFKAPNPETGEAREVIVEKSYLRHMLPNVAVHLLGEVGASIKKHL